jgi:hypothetical protein
MLFGGKLANREVFGLTRSASPVFHLRINLIAWIQVVRFALQCWDVWRTEMR